MTPAHHVFAPPRRKSGSLAWEAGSMDMGAWYAIHDPEEVPPGALSLVDRRWSGARGLRAARKPLRVLPTYEGGQGLVVDAELAEAIGELPGVTRRDITLRDDKGPLPTRYVLLDVQARVPLDRRHVAGSFTDGWLDVLRGARWGPGRVPSAPIFRLLERPRLLFVEPGLAKVLCDAAGGSALLDDYDADYPHAYFPPAWSLGNLPAVPEAPEAEAAFWALLGGDAAARPAAITSPWWAYAVARCVDGWAADDTRRAACGNAVVAALYASEVEGHDQPSLAEASAGHGLAALRYATHVRGAIDRQVLSDDRLAEAGHDQSTLAQHEGCLATLTGAPPTRPAPRIWPSHGRPRYADEADGIVPIEAEVRSDIDAFVGRGLARLGVGVEAAPDEVVELLQSHLVALASGEGRLGTGKRTTVQMELGCAWGEQLHRAFGWQWARVALPAGGGLALVSPDRALAHYPFDAVAPWLKRRAGSPTLLLLFNMIADGNVPPALPGALTTVQ